MEQPNDLTSQGDEDTRQSAIQRPTAALDAVLRPSDAVPAGSVQIRGIEFDAFRDRDITVRELVAGMATMGFQASAVADAVRIINDMVRSTALLPHLRHDADFRREKLDRPLQRCQNDHFPGIYIQPHLVGASGDFAISRPTPTCVRDRHHRGWD